MFSAKRQWKVRFAVGLDRLHCRRPEDSGSMFQVSSFKISELERSSFGRFCEKHRVNHCEIGCCENEPRST